MSVLSLLILLLFPTLVSAAPAVIGTPVIANSGANAASSLTVAATCPSGNTNVVAVACVATRKASGTAVNITGVTYDGTAMVSIGQQLDSATNGTYAELWQLTNPTCNGSSRNTVVSSAGTNFMVVGVLFLKDTDQGTPSDAAAGVNGTGTPATIAVPSAVGDLVVDCVSARNSTSNLIVGAGQTGVTDKTTNATASTNIKGGQSYETGAASVTMSWTDNDGVGWSIIGVSFNPVTVTVNRKRPAPRHYLRFFDGLVIPVALLGQ